MQAGPNCWYTPGFTDESHRNRTPRQHCLTVVEALSVCDAARWAAPKDIGMAGQPLPQALVRFHLPVSPLQGCSLQHLIIQAQAPVPMLAIAGVILAEHHVVGINKCCKWARQAGRKNNKQYCEIRQALPGYVGIGSRCKTHR